MTRRPTTGPRSPRGYRGSRSFGAPASRPDGAPGCPPPVTAPGCRSARLEGHHVLRSRALLALHHVVGEPLDRSCRTHCRTPLVVESPECDAAFVCLMRNFRTTRLRGNPSRSGGSPKLGGLIPHGLAKSVRRSFRTRLDLADRRPARAA